MIRAVLKAVAMAVALPIRLVKGEVLVVEDIERFIEAIPTIPRRLARLAQDAFVATADVSQSEKRPWHFVWMLSTRLFGRVRPSRPRV